MTNKQDNQLPLPEFLEHCKRGVAEDRNQRIDTGFYVIGDYVLIGTKRDIALFEQMFPFVTRDHSDPMSVVPEVVRAMHDHYAKPEMRYRDWGGSPLISWA